MIPAYYGQSRTQSYYNLTAGLPKRLPGVQANDELKNKFDIVSPYFILVDSDMRPSKTNKMVKKIEKVKGIDMTMSYAKLSSAGISEDVLSDDLRDMIDDGKHQIILISSKYGVATDELNSQIKTVNKIAKSYVSLPVILVIAIEFAIFCNTAVPFYMGDQIPFVAGIVIGTIQLGATIDYAVLMSTKYLEVRKSGEDKFQSVRTAMTASVSSIFVSALCFFAATIGVGFYSDMDMISAICIMLSRGALISMVTVIFVVPALLLLFDKIIIHTSFGFKGLKEAK